MGGGGRDPDGPEDDEDDEDASDTDEIWVPEAEQPVEGDAPGWGAPVDALDGADFFDWRTSGSYQDQQQASTQQAQEAAQPQGPPADGLYADLGDEEAPMVEVFTYVTCPDQVARGEPFALEAGLVAEAQGDLPPIDVPIRFQFATYVMAPSFRVVEGDVQTVSDVDLETTYPTHTVVLEALSGAAEDSEIHVVFLVDGAIVGSTAEPVQVSDTASAPTLRRSPSNVQPELAADLDLTMEVVHDSANNTVHVALLRHDAEVGFQAPSTAKTKLDAPLRDWFHALLKNLPAQVNEEAQQHTVRGLGRRLARMLPEDTAEIVHGLVAAERRAPTILCLSSESYIPWELALLEHRGQAERLGTCTRFGRWPHTPSLNGRQTMRRSIPPLDPIRIDQMVAGTSNYEREPLEHAIQEVEDLHRTWGATKDGELTVASLIACLEGNPPWQCLHLAAHGTNKPGSNVDGFEVADGFVDASVVEGTENPMGPVAFLNACQVGGASQDLVAWSGMPASFISRGAVAVVAPIWNVADGVARDVAIEFYELCQLEPPAEALRQLRARFDAAGGVPPSFTWLAYQFFGHPALTLELMTAATSEEEP